MRRNWWRFAQQMPPLPSLPQRGGRRLNGAHFLRLDPGFNLLAVGTPALADCPWSLSSAEKSSRMMAKAVLLQGRFPRNGKVPMNKAVGLAPYSVRISALYSGEEIDLNDFGDKSHDLLDFFRDSLIALKKTEWVDTEESKMLGVKQYSAHGERCLQGIIEYGDFGTESSIKDSVERTTVFAKARTHADMQRFYFLMSAPKNRNKGVIMLQKSGNIGVATQLKKLLQVGFEAQFPEYRLRIRPLSTQQIFNRYIDRGDLREIRLIRFRIPKGIEDAYKTGHEEIKGTCELVIKIKNGHGMPFARKVKGFFAKGGSSINEIIELGDAQFIPENIKFELSVKGKRRTVSMHDPRDVAAVYDVTDDVELHKDGYPKFESISGLAVDLLGDLEAELYGSGGA
jgi:hypothetical protein